MRMRRSRLFPDVVSVGSVLIALFYVLRPALGALGREHMARSATAAHLVEAQHRVAALSQRIAGLERAALAGDPKLALEQRQLDAELRQSLLEHGHDPQLIAGNLQRLRAELDDEKVPEPQKRQLQLELSRESNELRQAEQAALQDPKVRPAYEAFKKDLLAAMNSQDPGLPRLLQQLQQAERELRRLSGERAAS